MKVAELIDRLREYEPEAEIYVHYGRRSFALLDYVGIMDTSGWLDEEANSQLVISPWQPAAINSLKSRQG